VIVVQIPLPPGAVPIEHHCPASSRHCFPHEIEAPRAQVYPLPPPCGSPYEDPKRCSKEGEQIGPAGGYRELVVEGLSVVFPAQTFPFIAIAL
jgi:hypothetical protein